MTYKFLRFSDWPCTQIKRSQKKFLRAQQPKSRLVNSALISPLEVAAPQVLDFSEIQGKNSVQLQPISIGYLHAIRNTGNIDVI